MTALAFKEPAPRTPRLPSMRGLLKARRPVGAGASRTNRPPVSGASAWLLPWIAVFCGMVIAPTLLTLAYLGLIASNEYVAEARLAVRGTPEVSLAAGLSIPESMRSAISALSVGLGGTKSTSDVYVAASFIRSSAIVAELDRDGRLRKMFGDESLDWLSRYDPSQSIERLHSYWEGKVNASVDKLSGMVTLRVSAFHPAEAVSLAEDIIRSSERTVNALAERRRRDTVRYAEAEFSKAEQRFSKALLALKEFRMAESTPDHSRSIEMAGKALLELETERIGLGAQRSYLLQQLSPTASSLQPVNARIAALDDQVEAMKGQMASERAAARSAATLIGRLEALEVERYFAQRLYEMSGSALVRAREEAERQHLYLTVFVSPKASERPDHKALFSTTGLVFVLSLFTWGLTMLVVAGVADQRA